MNRSSLRFLILGILVLASCSSPDPGLIPGTEIPSRYSRIPEGKSLINPADDRLPPILHSPLWEQPQPMPGPINSPGGEDSPFITPDGRHFFFFFTPDVAIPAERQLTDGVTGIYQSKFTDGAWSDPVRLVLSDGLALDGCPTVVGNQIWFCTAREGFTGIHWFKASYELGIWGGWELADFEPSYQVGELHITEDLQELYFHSSRPGSLGKNDIWVSRWEDGKWAEPENIGIINSSEDDSRPFITPDGSQLWFTRTYQGYPAVYLSTRTNGSWGPPELVVSQFAAEPTLDQEGNLYFVHHYIWDGVMLDADIYVAKKK